MPQRLGRIRIPARRYEHLFTSTGIALNGLPQVTPNSAIYFYQFKQAGVDKTYWATRFAIADPSGATTPPTENVQPSGDNIPWGKGQILGGLGDSNSSSSVSNSAPPPSSSSSSLPSSSSSVVNTPSPSSPSSHISTPSGSHSSSNSVKPSSTGNSLSSGNSTSDDSGAIAIATGGAAGVFVALAAVFNLMF